jgi:hypothetical protein
MSPVDYVVTDENQSVHRLGSRRAVFHSFAMVSARHPFVFLRGSIDRSEASTIAKGYKPIHNQRRPANRFTKIE